jgi:glucose-6-phosphate 1-epimerase
MPDVASVPLPPSVTLSEGQGSMPVLRVASPIAQGELYLHGAHVSAWTPSEQEPVLWMSAASTFAAGQPIRGGIPVCFPWFGAGRTGDLAPAHGFARLADWSLLSAVDEGGVVTLTLRLTDADISGVPGGQAWSHPFEVTYTATFGADLRLALQVRNTGTEEYAVEEALHTYLGVEDISTVTVEGLDGASYLDKVAGGSPGPVQQGPVRFTGETDRVYSSTAEVSVVDPGRRRLTLVKDGSATTVVWNPWIAKAAAMQDFGDDEWPSMVCVETANVLEDAIVLTPGQSHTMTATYGCAAL